MSIVIHIKSAINSLFIYQEENACPFQQSKKSLQILFQIFPQKTGFDEHLQLQEKDKVKNRNKFF